MICPTCAHDNLPGADICASCQIDLTDLDRPIAGDRIERSLMEDDVAALKPRAAIALAPSATMSEAIATMLENNIGAVLIVDPAGHLLGILSERDLLIKVAGLIADYPARAVCEFMTPAPEVVHLPDTLAYALHQMDTGGYRHLPVVQQGRPVGVISVRDLLRHVTRICGHEASRERPE